MHEYQDTAEQFMYDNPFSALFMDTGLGKTVSCLTLINRLLLEDLSHRFLIIAPVRVATQTWPNEIGEWSHTAWLNATVLRCEDDDPEVTSAYAEAYASAEFAAEACAAYETGCESEYAEALLWGKTEAQAEKAGKTGGVKAAGAYQQAVAGKAATAKKEEIRLRKAHDGCSIHIINREALTWLVDQYSVWTEKKVNGKIRRIRKVVGWPYRNIIIDESSSFKDYKTARFKALVAVRAQGFVDRLHELTATPAAEGYEGLFAQIFLLDRGERLGNNITAYRTAYFMQERHNSRKYKLQRGSKEEIGDKIADITMVMKSGDYLEEIEPLFLPRKLHFTPPQAKQYKEMVRDFIMTLDDGTEIEAKTAADLSSKLLQIASGAIYTGDRDYKILHNHKIEDLQQLQEELGDEHPLLVGYWYRHSLARLRKAFPEARVLDKEGKIVSRHGPWNTGKVKMLLVHPASVGHGLNMQYGPGHDLYMFDQCWSYELYYQLYRRLWRQGQKLQVRVHLPQMIGTNDVLVAARLGEKEDAQEALFQQIRVFRRRMKEREITMKMAA